MTTKDVTSLMAKDNTVEEKSENHLSLSFKDKLRAVVSFYNLTNSEICSTICNISRMTLNEIIYENKDATNINQTKLNILYNIIIDKDILKEERDTLPSNLISPLLTYLENKEIKEEKVKEIVLDIIEKSKKEEKKNLKKQKHMLNREQQESNLESFLFFMKMLSNMPSFQ